MKARFEPPPYLYDGLDPVEERRSLFAEAAAVAKGAAGFVGDAIELGRRPGMPLGILGYVTRQAPLTSLLVAFVAGVAVARRR